MSSEHKLKTVVLETTRRCNLKCLHCGSDCDASSYDGELYITEWKRVISELADMRVEQIVFSGGEPFLKPCFDALIKHASEEGISFGIITNGIVLSDEYLEVLSKYPPFAIGISIDGGMETHNHIRQNKQAWINSLQTIRRLVEAGIPTVVNTTVSKLNYLDLPIIGHTLNALEVAGWQIQIAAPMGRMKKSNDLLDVSEFNYVCKLIYDLRGIYPRMKISGADCFGLDSYGLVKAPGWSGCSAGIYGLGIKANGDVLPCLSLYDEQFVCGNVRQQSIIEIWQNDDNFKFNREFELSEVDNNSRCVDCARLSSCRGGCASMSWAFNGHYHDAPFCVNRDYQIKNQQQEN